MFAPGLGITEDPATGIASGPLGCYLVRHQIVPPERFEILSGKDDLATYTFNTGVAKHTFCKVCGMHPFYVPRSDPDKIDVNARCIDDIDLAALKPKYFDGRNWETAMQCDVPWR